MIGVFDSGFGGLVVLREFLGLLPLYDYLYLGDNARIPYGTRSDRVVIRFTRQAVDYLFGQGCQLIILACHTASAKALRTIQQTYLPGRYPGRRVLGVLIPTVEEALALSPRKRIGVIGTDMFKNAFDAIDARLVHAIEKLPRIGRKRLDVAPLAFRVDRVERERGFAGPGNAGHDDQLVQRKLEVEALQVVLTGPTDEHELLTHAASRSASIGG